MSPPASRHLRTKRLSCANELDAARALLYHVYYEEQGWHPFLGNLSDQHVQGMASGELGFVDRYDETCTWFGLFSESYLVGCIRMIERSTHEDQLELENYHQLPGSLLKNKINLTEINRLALLPAHRGGHGLPMLLVAVLEFTRRNAYTLIAPILPKMFRLASHHMGMSDTGHSFKYHPDDPEPVAIYLLHDIERVDKQIRELYRLIHVFDTIS